MFNPNVVSPAKRVAYVAGHGYKLAMKQATSVAYRRATNGQKPKNEREQVKVM